MKRIHKVINVFLPWICKVFRPSHTKWVRVGGKHHNKSGVGRDGAVSHHIHGSTRIFTKLASYVNSQDLAAAVLILDAAKSNIPLNQKRHSPAPSRGELLWGESPFEGGFRGMSVVQ
jgi:hypothetical protein